MSIQALQHKVQSLDVWPKDIERQIRRLPLDDVVRAARIVATRSRSREMIDDVLQCTETQLLECVARVRRARNFLAPINRLPPELLCYIFKLATATSMRLSYRQRLNVTLYTILNVCRLWHNVAMSCADLWATLAIDFRTPEVLFAKILGRSGILPLEVTVCGGEKILGQLLPHMYRLRKLHVVVKNKFRYVTRMLRFAAPQLEALQVDIPHHVQQGTLIGSLPIFAHKVPRLAHLNISRHVPWPGNLFPSLTRLYISSIYCNGDTALSDFLDFIEASPMLEELTFEDAGPYEFVDYWHRSSFPRKVSLPRMRTLIFEDCRWEVTACLLRHLEFINGVTIQASPITRIVRESDFLAILLGLASNTRFLGEATGLSLWLLGDAVLLVCRGTKACLTFDAVLDTTIPQYLCKDITVASLKTLTFLLPLHTVKDIDLYVGGFAPPSPADVHIFLSNVSSGESCTIWIDTEVLDRRYWKKVLSPKVSVPLPRLKMLRFVGEFPVRYKPHWMLGLAISRAKQGYRLSQLNCTTVSFGRWSAEFAQWDETKLHLNGERVGDFVDGLQLDAVEMSPMDPPFITGWDGII